MSDYIGEIEVPEISASGVFPIVPDYGYGLSLKPQVAIHQFGSANAKIEQRFLLGNGAKVFTLRRASLTLTELGSLKTFWESKYGPYGAFTYNAPNDNGLGTTAYTCRFANEPLSFEFLADAIVSTGITLIEIPSDSQIYTLNSTVTRFPSSALKTALLDQVQEIIPLIKIIPRGTTAVTVDGRCVPWKVNGSINEEFAVDGLEGGLDPIALRVVPGDTVTVDYVSGLASIGGLYGDHDADGQTGGANLAGVSGQTSYWLNPATVICYAGALIGAFVDTDGQVLEVVAINNHASLTVPTGAAKLQMGMNDGTSWSDNRGSWQLSVNTNAAGYPTIYLSDRRCTVGGQLYLARLLEFSGISQSLGNESDQAQFTFGNADRVMRNLANSVDLFRAGIEFSLFHVGSGIKLDLWKGEIIDWHMDQGPEFSVTAADGIYELTLPYPTRRISRTCGKAFDDGQVCPFTTMSTGMDTTHFPDCDETKCDKGYDTANGCLAHGMKHYFGGILAKPQGVKTKDNSTGTWGFGRSNITSTSIVEDSIYDQVVPEIYTNGEAYKDAAGVVHYGRLVNCKIAAGRDEGDFYAALGIVGAGPITFGDGHTLDGQFHHGYPGVAGLREIEGHDPAFIYDFFSLGQAGGSGGDWRKYQGSGWTWEDNFAAGLAFLEIRRKDTQGIQLSYPSSHGMQAIITQGLEGWVWTAAGSRTEQVLTNPIWIAVNMLLRARGLANAGAAIAEQTFDVTSAIAAAAICDTLVEPLVGRTQNIWHEEEEDPETHDIIPGYWEDVAVTEETQFEFCGIIQEEKPLRDWIQEVLMNCLGNFTSSFGKLEFIIRSNSSVSEAFTEGNILFGSLQLAPIKPIFNHLTANFAEREFNYSGNSLQVYDIDHATLLGGATAPLFLKSQVNLSGVSTKSQASRIISTRIREELGGITAEQWLTARQISFKTTVLALNAKPGTICSMSHSDMPAGVHNGTPTPNYGEFRIKGWKLNKDYSIDIEGPTTVDEMYDLTVGPKPADVEADPLPIEDPVDLGYPDIMHAYSLVDGMHLRFGGVAEKHNDTIYLGEFRALYVPAGGNADANGYVDLRTPDEGGTLVHNGTTAFVVTGLFADWSGCQYYFDSPAAGRWYFAFRLRNHAGWSVWTDGNYYPDRVHDYCDTEDPDMLADGPAADWDLLITAAPGGAHAVVVTATRPIIHGKRIYGVVFQIKDVSDYPDFLDIDAGDEPAEIIYDGSTRAHTYDANSNVLTRTDGEDWLGEYFEFPLAVGDLVLFDVRNGSAGGYAWDRQNCQWATIKSFTARQIIIQGKFNLFPTGEDYLTSFRVMVVKPLWKWIEGGYFGESGIFWREFFLGGKKGDTTTQAFVSDPIQVPADVPLTDIKAVVWFDNGYSRSNDDTFSPIYDGDPDVESGYEINVPDDSVLSINAKLSDTQPRRVYFTQLLDSVGSTRVVGNPTGAKHRQPMAHILKQSASGGLGWTLGDKYRLPSDGSLFIRPSTRPNAQDYIGYWYDAYDDKFDVVSFVKNYGA